MFYVTLALSTYICRVRFTFLIARQNHNDGISEFEARELTKKRLNVLAVLYTLRSLLYIVEQNQIKYIICLRRIKKYVIFCLISMDTVINCQSRRIILRNFLGLT